MLSVSDLPFPKFSPTKVLNNTLPRKQYELHTDLYAEQWMIPAGTTVWLMTSQNFGWVILPPRCQDKRGFEIPRRVFKY